MFELRNWFNWRIGNGYRKTQIIQNSCTSKSHGKFGEILGYDNDRSFRNHIFVS